MNRLRLLSLLLLAGSPAAAVNAPRPGAAGTRTPTSHRAPLNVRGNVTTFFTARTPNFTLMAPAMGVISRTDLAAPESAELAQPVREAVQAAAAAALADIALPAAKRADSPEAAALKLAVLSHPAMIPLLKDESQAAAIAQAAEAAKQALSESQSSRLASKMNVIARALGSSQELPAEDGAAPVDASGAGASLVRSGLAPAVAGVAAPVKAVVPPAPRAAASGLSAVDRALQVPLPQTASGRFLDQLRAVFSRSERPSVQKAHVLAAALTLAAGSIIGIAPLAFVAALGVYASGAVLRGEAPGRTWLDRGFARARIAASRPFDRSSVSRVHLIVGAVVYFAGVLLPASAAETSLLIAGGIATLISGARLPEDGRELSWLERLRAQARVYFDLDRAGPVQGARPILAGATLLVAAFTTDSAFSLVAATAVSIWLLLSGIALPEKVLRTPRRGSSVSGADKVRILASVLLLGWGSFATAVVTLAFGLLWGGAAFASMLLLLRLAAPR